MAFVAPINKDSAVITVQTPPTVIVVTQTVLSPMGMTPSVGGGSSGTRGYASVG